jgi:hypothetical protein
VRAGEAVLLPRNDPHVLGSHIGLRPVCARSLVKSEEGGGLTRIVHGGGGEATHMVCGFLASDQHRNPLITTLPRVLKIDMTQTGSDEWIESSLRFALRGLSEGLLGASTVMSKLSELMFVEAVRRYADTLPPEERGWLAGTRRDSPSLPLVTSVTLHWLSAGIEWRLWRLAPAPWLSDLPLFRGLMECRQPFSCRKNAGCLAVCRNHETMEGSVASNFSSGERSAVAGAGPQESFSFRRPRFGAL